MADGTLMLQDEVASVSRFDNNQAERDPQIVKARLRR